MTPADIRACADDYAGYDDGRHSALLRALADVVEALLDNKSPLEALAHVAALTP